jgi:hypothetical protein
MKRDNMITKSELLLNVVEKLHENVEKTEKLFNENPVEVVAGSFKDDDTIKGYQILYLPISKKFIIVLVTREGNHYGHISPKFDVYEYNGNIKNKDFYLNVPTFEEYLKDETDLEKVITITCKYSTISINLTLKYELQYLTFLGVGVNTQDAFYHAFIKMKKGIGF